ncbi:heterokaryon incompatibility protein-domain-containing protein [Boeremia exigua]|uniref:heterokaryon incompatibility protein-domain-containing protein n=1 Tax=Boeremia exigua TaxID=749465 RepID=UPI001E8D6183|nr:heterokaryon incompatibility protein-domain-containing protein [Boeremia exigua]KAH6616364.1 heterokaryon incompatibility protein-domain-containing protein [Boeremia exigua]
MTHSLNQLCDRCRELDLESYVELRVKTGRGTIAFIEKASIRKTCELCTQFAHIFSALKALRAQVSNLDSFTLDFRRIQLNDLTIVYFRVRFMEFSRVLDFDFDFYPTAAVIEDVSSQKTLVPLCQTMRSGSSNLGLAKQWLQSCQTNHKECQQSTAWDTSLRVLNCTGQTLVTIDPSEPYACLSYVWGSQLVDHQLDSANPVPNVPQTITNAMSVCIALGIQYLWVDRYCIDQNNPTEKYHLISNMDRIYQGAELTIVASAGQGPDDGLPGVQTTPRRVQLYLKAGTHVFASTENIREQINTSTWNSRGWTYQEMLLSRRRLVFTDSQMYFQCQCTHYLESLHMAATAEYAPLRDRYRVFPSLEVSSLQNRLAEYYQRHLSVQSDVINAFAGVCNSALALKISPMSSNVLSHFYGIPIHYSRTRFLVRRNDFLVDLAWRVMHRESTFEPPQFPLTIPTWSWASPKVRHRSSGFSGEYIQPPTLTIPAPDLNPRCVSSSGTIVELANILQQDTGYTGFYPQILLDGILVKVPAQPKSSTFYLDSQEPLNFDTLYAMYLGYNERTRHPQSWTQNFERLGSNLCLLLQALTPEQLSEMHGTPHLTGRSCYRRVGLWIHNTSCDFLPGLSSSASVMNAMCKQLRVDSPYSDWKWFDRPLILV